MDPARKKLRKKWLAWIELCRTAAAGIFKITERSGDYDIWYYRDQKDAADLMYGLYFGTKNCENELGLMVIDD